jgi:hypothetical protein
LGSILNAQQPLKWPGSNRHVAAPFCPMNMKIIQVGAVVLKGKIFSFWYKNSLQGKYIILTKQNADDADLNDFRIRGRRAVQKQN